MEIGGISNQASSLTIPSSGLDRIAEKLNQIQKKDDQSTRSSFLPDTADAASQFGRVPSLHHIMPDLLKLLAELKSDVGNSAALTSTSANQPVKDPKDISPLSFLTSQERDSLEKLLNELLKKGESGKTTSTTANSQATTTSQDQWALFNAFRRVDDIISRGENRLHESVERQLTPKQQLLGHFLSEAQQEEAIGLLAQKGLLQEKARNNPLSEQEKSLLQKVDTQITNIFANAEKTLQDAGVNIQELNKLLTKYASAGAPTAAEITKMLGTATSAQGKKIQGELAEILGEGLPQTQSAKKSSPSALKTQEERTEQFLSENLSNRQQIIMALLSPQDHQKVMGIYEQLGKLTGKASLSPTEAKDVAKLTNQASELLQSAEKKLSKQGIDVDKLAGLLTGNKIPSQQQVEEALGVKSGQSNLNSAQENALSLLEENFLDGAEGGAGAAETSVRTEETTQGVGATAVSTLLKKTKKNKGTEFPTPLTPLQALQKRIEAAQKALKENAIRKQHAVERDKTLGAPMAEVSSKQPATAAQPAQKPVEVELSGNQLAAAGLGGIGIGRSRSN